MKAGIRSNSSLRYIHTKPKGPVRKNTTSVELTPPTCKRGFVMPKFCGKMYVCTPFYWLRGVVGPTRKDGRTATSCNRSLL